MEKEHDKVTSTSQRSATGPLGPDEPTASDIDRGDDDADASTLASPAGNGPAAAGLPGRIGRYAVKSVLGAGGMGTVYLAEQETPQRMVALKVMRHGVTSRSALRRFEFEAQALGRLRHPGIAQVYEAGTHDDGAGGVPYFGMEYISDARTITEYADAEGLRTPERLELLAKVCDAVHYGHQKGVIHRDLKPSNILVDSWGQPKIIDFGVARATDSDIAVTTMHTEVGQLIGTLQYMSPEQCEADPGDLDTRSDVYALGVVLYELLCDRLPYDLSRAAVPEAVRVIREELPDRPSTVDRALRGDVETITLKALEKDRDRRYSSAEALADDLRRYLRSEPIEARPPSVTYQLGRFARRHKPLVIGIAGIFAVLVGGIAATSLALVRALEAEEQSENRLIRAQSAEADASRRAEELEQVARFQASQLAGIDVPRMGVRLHEDIVDRVRAGFEASGLEEDAIADRIQVFEQTLANANFTNVALGTLEENVFDRAVASVEQEFGDQPLVRARLLQSLALTLRKLGLLDRALTLQAEAIEVRRRLLGNDDPDTLLSISSMGALLLEKGDFLEAERCLRETLEGRRRVLGPEHEHTLASISNLGVALRKQGRLAEAEAHYREAMEASRRVLGADHPSTLTSIKVLGNLLRRQGKLSDAEPLLREALDGRRRVLGEDHPSTISSIASTAQLLQDRGKLAEAEPYYREVLERTRRVLGDEHRDTLGAVNSMGFLLLAQGQVEEAEPYYRHALDTRRRVLGVEHPDTLVSMNNMGYLLVGKGDLDEAELLYREALEIRRDVLGDDHPDTLVSIINLARFLNDQDRYAESEPLIRLAVETGPDVLGEDNWRLSSARSLRGDALRGLKRYDEAEAFLVQGQAGLKETLPEGLRADKLPAAIERLIRLYEESGQPAQAAAWRDRLAVWDK